MRAFKTLEQSIMKDDPFKERNDLREWFRSWAFTEPQRDPSIGATVMTERQLEQYEFDLLNKTYQS